MVKSYKLTPCDLSSEGEFNSIDEELSKKMSAYLISITPVIWRTDFTIDDIFVRCDAGSKKSGILKYYLGIDDEIDTYPAYVVKDGKQYCVSDYPYYLRNATQDQVEISNYMYGRERGKLLHRPYNWSKCLVLWKDDFFRIANPEEMDKDRMLQLYLGIFATGFQDGVGSIDGYQISDYENFVQVATEEQVRAVNAEISRRKNELSVIAKMKLKALKRSVSRVFRWLR